MKSIFNKTDRAEIIGRIATLTHDNKPGWGKMSVEQMVKHCTLCEEYYFGKVPVKRAFLGRIIGKMALKGMLKPGTTLMWKNSKTAPAFLVTGEVDDLEGRKRTWQSLVKGYEAYAPEDFTHWFFGKMTKEQLGLLIYLHNNHHLTQFGA
jgi:Protein of unknown function (DUF1569)